MAQKGWIGMTWPKEYGGQGKTYVDRTILMEEALKYQAPIGAHFLGDRQIGPCIIHFGTEEQKREWLPKILNADVSFCLLFSEPGAGSDLVAVSTRAESRLYRSWGVDIIGMTALPEAKLAREAEICYATMAHVTDYDVWHETEAPVTVAMLIENLTANAAVTKQALVYLAPMVAQQGKRKCKCPSALATAVITQRDMIPAQVKKDLGLLLDKYLR
jgi:hypothetical protein